MDFQDDPSTCPPDADRNWEFVCLNRALKIVEKIRTGDTDKIELTSADKNILSSAHYITKCKELETLVKAQE